MACLPAPTLSFTIPSLQDDLTLECRVYHPKCLVPTSISHVTEWNKKAAIVAHPYATLGGCMDDPIVGLIATICLSEGYVVGTFNFRGAGYSGGRTSWQGKGEQSDYKSFIAFMTYYIHHLSPPSIISEPNFSHFSPELHNLSPIPSQVLPPPRSRKETQSLPIFPTSNKAAPARQPLLLLAGYSYGALITASLPPITSSILTPFQTPSPGSPYYSIRLRAQSLAAQQNAIISATVTHLLQSTAHHRGRSLNSADVLSNPKLRSSTGVRTGGDENLRRASYDSHRSFSMDATTTAVRKSVDRVRSMTSPKRARSYRSAQEQGHRSAGSQDSLPSTAKSEEEHLPPVPGIETQFQTAYLLVSPLQGLVSNLVTMWNFSKSVSSSLSISSSRSKDRDKYKERDRPPALSEHEKKLTIDPTLAVYGDSDVFVSVKRLRTWAGKLSACGKGTFRHVEVEGAGHFWTGAEDVGVLREEVRSFVRGL